MWWRLLVPEWHLPLADALNDYVEHRDHEKNRDRHGPALVQCREYQKHEHQRQDEDIAGLPAGFLFLVSRAGPFVAIAFRQCSGHLLHGLGGLSRTVAWCGSAIDCGG